MSTRLTEDDRYEIAARAEAGARANRPTHLVLGASLALLAATAAAGLGWRADAGAASTLKRKSNELLTINERAGQLSELIERQAESPRDDQNAPIPDMLSRLQNAAREAGLDTLPEVPRTENESFQSARRVNYRYTSRDRSQVRDQSLEKLLTWISLATERIPGLYVRQISLKPQANAWLMEVTFARYERIDE